MAGTVNKIKLGELLVDAGIVTSGDLTEAIQVSRRLGVPIGRVLLVSGCVTEAILEAALEAQPLVKDGTISRSSAVEALKKAAEDVEGNRQRRVVNDSEYEDNQQLSKRLGDLLLDSEIVNQDQLDQAMMTSFSSGMPLGSALVLEGVLSPSLFPSILRIQRNIKDGRLSREEGIDEIKSTFLHWMKAEESLARGLEEADLEELLSTSNLASLGVIPDSHRERAEKESVPQSKSEAPERKADRESHDEHRPEPRRSENGAKPTFEKSELSTPASKDSELPPLIDLLKEAGCLSNAEIQAAYEEALTDPVRSAQIFLLLGLVDEETVETALRSYSLRERQLVNHQEAIAAIKVSHEDKQNEQIFEEDPRMKRFYDKNWRKQAASKVLGGIAVGAALAGLSLFKKKK